MNQHPCFNMGTRPGVSGPDDQMDDMESVTEGACTPTTTTAAESVACLSCGGSTGGSEYGFSNARPSTVGKDGEEGRKHLIAQMLRSNGVPLALHTILTHTENAMLASVEDFKMHNDQNRLNSMSTDRSDLAEQAALFLTALNMFGKATDEAGLIPEEPPLIRDLRGHMMDGTASATTRATRVEASVKSVLQAMDEARKSARDNGQTYTLHRFPQLPFRSRVI